MNRYPLVQKTAAHDGAEDLAPPPGFEREPTTSKAPKKARVLTVARTGKSATTDHPY